MLLVPWRNERKMLIRFATNINGPLMLCFAMDGWMVTVTGRPNAPYPKARM
jgi:hypothetical protein